MDFIPSVFSQRDHSNNPYSNEVDSRSGQTKSFVCFFFLKNTTILLWPFSRLFGWTSSRESYRRCRRGRLRKTRRGGCPAAAPRWATGSSLSGTMWCPLWSRCSKPQSGHAHRGASVSDWAKRGKTEQPLPLAPFICRVSECGRESGESFLFHTKPPTRSQTRQFMSEYFPVQFYMLVVFMLRLIIAGARRRLIISRAWLACWKRPPPHPHTTTTTILMGGMVGVDIASLVSVY